MDLANPCCVLWKTRYSKMEEKRNALRQGVEILKGQIDRLQEENANLKKACDEERKRADVVEEKKAKEASLRISMEKEIVALKSEITSTKPEVVSGNEDLNKEVTLLRTCISEREMEIYQLKQLITEVERRADAERECGELERKRASELQEALELEKTRAYEASKMSNVVGKKDEENRFQLETLKIEVEEAKLKCEEVNRKLETEKQKSLKEKKRADEEKARAIEQNKIAEANEIKLMEEKSRANSLLMQLEEEKQKVDTLQKELQEVMSFQRSADLSEVDEVKRNLEAEKKRTSREKKRADAEMSKKEEQKKIAEANIKKAMEEKCRAEEMSQNLHCSRQRVEDLERELRQLNDMLEAERKKASSEQKRADAEKLKADEHGRISLENDKRAMVDEVKRNLEAEKKRTAREKKRADAEMSKKEEHKKIAEANIKKAMEEKCRADELSQNLHCSRQRIEDLGKELHELNHMLEAERKKASSEQKRADAEKLKTDEHGRISLENEKRAMEEKHRADNLSQKLQNDRQRLLELENELHKLKLGGNLGVASSVPSTIIMNEQTAKVSLLQKQLKFEKQRVKHAKEVAKLEKGCSRILQQELHRLKQEFKCLLHHLDVLSDTFGARYGVNNISKKLGLSNVQDGKLSRRMLGSSPSHVYASGDAELRMSSLSSKDASCHLKENKGYVPAGHCTGSPSGMEIELDLLLGGSRGETLPSYALNLNTASFSDEQLVGSQEGVAGSLTTSVVLAAENTNLQGTTGKQYDECCKWNGEKIGIVAENSIRSPAETGHAKKKRKILDEFESIKLMHSKGKRIFQEAEEKLSSLHDTLVQPIIKQMEKENLPLTVGKANSCGNFDQSSKKRKVASHEPEATLRQVNESNIQMQMDKLEDLTPTVTKREENFQALQDASRNPVKYNEDTLISFEQMTNGDYMKLLNLDDAEEEYFRRAMERPLSPALPEIDLCNSKIGITPDKSSVPIPACTETGDQHSSAHDKSQLYCVVFSDMKDISSISKIFGATRTCFSRCCLFLQRNWMVQDILAALSLEKDLRPREKVCVLFSLILLNLSGISTGRFEHIQNQELLDSFSAHIRSVLCSVETRNLFAEICDFSELLNLVEDFVLSRRILLQSNKTSASVNSPGSAFEIVLEREKAVLCPNMASTNLVMGGSIVLASICTTVGHVDFICEVSFNVLCTCGTDKSLVLMILHIFVYICGEEYFTNRNYHLVMAVVKSMVAFIEGTMAENGNIVPQPGDVSQPGFSPCVTCPFSKDCVSLEDVSSLLLKELQNYCMEHTGHQDLADLGDVLSSLELVAYKMGWDWAYEKIVPKLFRMLESCDQERVFTALVTFIGQLGRLGVESCGYENAGVESMRCHLLGILSRAVTSKCNTPVSMAIVSALVGLHPKGHDEFVKGNASGILRDYLSSLSSDQISSLFGIHRSPVIAA